MKVDESISARNVAPQPDALISAGVAAQWQFKQAGVKLSNSPEFLYDRAKLEKEGQSLSILKCGPTHHKAISPVISMKNKARAFR